MDVPIGRKCTEMPYALKSEATLRLLISQIREKDKCALKALYQCTSSRIFQMLCFIGYDREIAEDALVDVFTRIWKEAPEFEPNSESPTQWIISIVRTSIGGEAPLLPTACALTVIEPVTVRGMHP